MRDETTDTMTDGATRYETSRRYQTKGDRVRSSFIIQLAYPRSSVTPTLAGSSGRRPPEMWWSPSRPPAVWWSRPGWRYGSGGGTSYSQAWPAKTHLHPIMASLWSERTEGLFPNKKQTNKQTNKQTTGRVWHCRKEIPTEEDKRAGIWCDW